MMGQRLPGLLEVAVLPGAEVYLLERNARLRGKGVITAGLQAALFHPILSEVPEKAFGKARRKYARMSAEIAVGQLE